MSRLRKILRLQFGLRTLLAVVLVGALVSAYVADLLNTSRAQRRFLELAKEAGISVQVNSADCPLEESGVHLGTFDQITSVQFSDRWRRNIAGEPSPIDYSGEPDFDELIDLITSTVAPSNSRTDRDPIAAREECTDAIGDLHYLRSLNLHYQHVTDSQLQPLGCLKRLSLLGLDNTGLTDVGAAHLAGLTALRRLSVGNTEITDCGLAHLDGLSNLEVLDAGSTRLADGASEHLNALANLRWLYLDETKIARLHLRDLKRLEYLTLYNAPVRDLTFEGCDSLRVLDLWRTNVTDESLASVGRLKSLEELHLAGKSWTARGLAHLRGLPKLKKLHLEVDSFDPEFAEQLRDFQALEVLALHDIAEFLANNPAERDAELAKWGEALSGIEIKWKGFDSSAVRQFGGGFRSGARFGSGFF